MQDIRTTGADPSGVSPLYQHIVEHAPSAIVLVGLAGHIELLNLQAEKLFGYGRHELIGQPVEVLLPMPSRAAHPELRRSFFDTPTSRQMASARKINILQRDGTELPVEIRLHPIFTESEPKVIAIVSDASQQRRQEENFRLAIEASPSALLMVNVDGIIEMTNQQTSMIFGYPADELLGQPIEKLIPRRFENHRDLRNAYITAPQPRAMGRGRDLYAHHRNGTEIRVEVGLNPIRATDGTKILCSVIDITERVTAKERLETQQFELKRSNDELSAFAYVASHDLKSPLRGISQLANWITEDLAEGNTASIEGHLQMMQQRIARMEKLLDDLLIYSRVGRSTSLMENIDAYELVRQIFDSYLPVSSFQLRLKGKHFPMRTCPATLEQVLRNLMSNAVKHHDRSRGTITVAVSLVADDLAEFKVIDDGPGIASKFHQRIFQMFQTLRPRDEVEGSGMGLALVKKLVENAGGKISLLSNAPTQRGCTFIFTWPIKPTLHKEA
ncbi:sensor histidine kinase [Herbaspirillum rubrisubalbicans]|uniref:sensor histidine kinase n=1 Tax=Herbaspirillum rubrisubalbicans TaxID=80842 RepID=UPI000300E4C3|nr:PAS domain S-box protein [Herbaspirillum rubrisubalbicans]